MLAKGPNMTSGALRAYIWQVYPEGRMSQAMDHLKIGETMDFKGPKGRFHIDQNEKRAIGETTSIHSV